MRLVTGETREGRIRYVAKSAIADTRTYRVEVELPNADGAIPDGITAEVAIPLSPVPATRVPRSALIVLVGGRHRRAHRRAPTARSVSSVSVVEDEQTFMWLAGVPDGARVIVQGQDFVREGRSGRGGRRGPSKRRSADGAQSGAKPCRASSITPSATRG